MQTDTPDSYLLKAVTDETNTSSVYRDPSSEAMFCRYVTEGAVSDIQRLISHYSFLDLIGQVPLAADPVMNLKYHFVEIVFMLSHACTKSGMPAEAANGLRCYYIREMDASTDCLVIKQLLDQALLDYTKRMLSLRKNKATSRAAMESINYIYAHISERITVEDIAEAVKVSPSHLSRVFKKELGIPISDYIRARKLDIAKGLLQYTDYSQVDISNKLAFSSQSHFIQQFRSLTGMTPKAYRNQHQLKGVRE